MIWTKLAIIAAAASLGYGVTLFFPKVKEDNVVEEAMEEIIKQQTGIDVDLTPNSKEK